MNIEVKNLPTEPAFDPDRAVARDVWRPWSGRRGHRSVVVSSFWSGALAAVRSAGSGLATGLLVLPSFDVAAAVAGAVDLGCAAIHLPVPLVDRGHRDRGPRRRPGRGRLDGGDGGRLAAVLAAGVDTVITDDVALARRAVDGCRRPRPGRGAGCPDLGRRPDWSNGVGFRQQCTAMNVVVCVKQIPDPAAPPALDPGTKNLVRDGKLILDDSDAYGVEMALQLADAAGGGEVTLVSMAPNGEVSGLRTALAMGAAKAILVSDPSWPAPTPSAPPRCWPPPSSGPSPT